MRDETEISIVAERFISGIDLPSEETTIARNTILFVRSSLSFLHQPAIQSDPFVKKRHKSNFFT